MGVDGPEAGPLHRGAASSRVVLAGDGSELSCRQLRIVTALRKGVFYRVTWPRQGGQSWAETLSEPTGASLGCHRPLVPIPG